MALLSTLLDICLLRGRPQDLPVSRLLVVVTGVASVMMDVVVGLDTPDPGLRMMFATVHALMFGLVVYGVLKLHGVVERWLQTLTALYAANAAVTVIAWPLSRQIAGTELQDWPGWAMLALFGIGIWFLMIMSQVLREALEVPVGRAVIISLASSVFALLVSLTIFAALAPRSMGS